MTSPTPRTHRSRWLRRLGATLSCLTAGGVLVAGSLAETGGAPATPAGATSSGDDLRLAAATLTRRWPGHPGRSLVRYTVRRGDTATGLAVRYHAWTDELRAINHLGRHGHLYAGDRITIPVVVAAARKARRTHASHTRHRTSHHSSHRTTHHSSSRRPWVHSTASRATVRRVVVRAAHRYHVDSRLALAIAWQESGWQQRRVSSAGAVGVMQVLPSTARWLSEAYVGRRLNVHGLYDNVTAGVLLLRVLDRQTTTYRTVGGYYQGLGSLLANGPHDSTKQYVSSVLHLRGRIARGWNPA